MLLPDAFSPLWSPPPPPHAAGLWFVFHNGRLLVRTTADGTDIPPAASDPPIAIASPRCIGLWGTTPCWAAEAATFDLPPDAFFAPLRALFERLPEPILAMAGRAIQVLEFERTHRFCGACAAPTEVTDGGRARECPRCGTTSYPRLAPSMMVLVTRQGPAGRELLLARGTRFGLPIYSPLSGFVEPSETLEACVHREVREEVGIQVCNLRYFGSQCWPFPHSLMVAFVADYAGGDITPDPNEIADAGWFSLDALPALPNKLSVARALIDHAIATWGSAPPA